MEPGDDTVVAGSGRDDVGGGPGGDRRFGGAGADFIGDRPATAASGGGLVYRQGRDHVDAGSGDDGITGSRGGGVLVGGLGNDTLCGGPAPDVLDGGRGAGRDLSDGDGTSDRPSMGDTYFSTDRCRFCLYQ